MNLLRGFEKRLRASPIPSAEEVLRAQLDYQAAKIFCKKRQKEAASICGGDTSVGRWRACEAAMKRAEDACAAALYWEAVFLFKYQERYNHPHAHEPPPTYASE